jgi:excisionase family DNA binding protein
VTAAAEWLTPREAASLLRVNYRTVLDACSTDQLPHVRVGRAIRIPLRALQREAVGLAEPARAATPDVSGAVLNLLLRDEIEVDRDATG